MKLHSSSATRGVGPAERTGKSRRDVLAGRHPGRIYVAAAAAEPARDRHSATVSGGSSCRKAAMNGSGTTGSAARDISVTVKPRRVRSVGTAWSLRHGLGARLAQPWGRCGVRYAHGCAGSDSQWRRRLARRCLAGGGGDVHGHEHRRRRRPCTGGTSCASIRQALLPPQQSFGADTIVIPAGNYQLSMRSARRRHARSRSSARARASRPCSRHRGRPRVQRHRRDGGDLVADDVRGRRADRAVRRQRAQAAARTSCSTTCA